MSDDGLRTAYKYKLKPTLEQERQLEQTLWRCRTRYHTALEERITADQRWGVTLNADQRWGVTLNADQRWGVTLNADQQQAEVPDLKAAFPEYGEIHSQVLQDVLARLDKTYRAFFRRVKAGQTPGVPRYQGRNRYHSFTYKQYGNGVRLAKVFGVLSKIGRVGVRWSRPLEGTAKTVTLSREAEGWYAVLSCADVSA